VERFGCILIKKKKKTQLANNISKKIANVRFVIDVAEKYTSAVKEAREGCVPQTKGGVFGYR